MKLHDFGLWFKCWDTGQWLATALPRSGFWIFYDGVRIGWMNRSSELGIVYTKYHIIKLKSNFPTSSWGGYNIGRALTFDDFEIIENPEYGGEQ